MACQDIRVPSTTCALQELFDDGFWRQVFKQIARALHTVHARGMVHGDIKTDNVSVVSVGGDVVLLDLGKAVPVSQAKQAEAVQSLGEIVLKTF